MHTIIIKELTTSKLMKRISNILLAASIYSLLRSNAPYIYIAIISFNAIGYRLIARSFEDSQNGGKRLENNKTMIKIAEWTIEVEKSFNKKKENLI